MRRRQFIALFGGVAAWWPLAARAQQASIPVIGWLATGSGHDPIWASYVTAFEAGLKETGYVEGQNVAIDFRWAEDQYDQLPALAKELAHKQVAVIAAGAPPAAVAAKAATDNIPIVFIVGNNPVKLGLVASLSHPDENATGINLTLDEVEAKRLGLLHEILPAATKIAVLFNPKRPDFESLSKDLVSAAQARGVNIVTLTAANSQEIDEISATLSQMHVGALLVSADVAARRFWTSAGSTLLVRPATRLLIASLVFCGVSATAAIAMDRGQFANVPLEVHEWFEHLRSPNGVPCCSYADGHRTGYDMRQGQYWVLIEGEWYPVPSEAIIKTANPVGEAIVWYVSTYADVRANPKYRVLCFVPSDGV